MNILSLYDNKQSDLQSMFSENVKVVNSSESSYFIETLNFLIDIREEFNNHNKVFYRGIHESAGDPVAIHESFTDFFTWIKELFTKIINFIKKLYNKFVTFLHGLVKSDKFIRKNKDLLNKFESKHEFQHTGYKFTFGANIPNEKPITDFKDSIENFKDHASYTSGPDMTPDRLANILKDTREKYVDNLHDNVYDDYRAKVINQDGSIAKEDFAKELFSLFRDNNAIKEEFTVTSSFVNECYTHFDGYEKEKNNITKAKDKVEREYDNIRKSIESALKKNEGLYSMAVEDDIKPIKMDDKLYTKDVITQLDLFLKAKANEIQELSNIHTMAFSAKLDALKDCFSQDKDILYKALYKLQGER